MQPALLDPSLTSLNPARKGSQESATQAADAAFASPSSLSLNATPNAAPPDQQDRRRLDNTYFIKRDRIVADPDQPRRDFDEKEMEQLVSSIRSRGMKQPISVRWDADAQRYRVIDGGRRFEAASRLALEEIPCWIQNVQGRDILIDQVVHNWQRVDLKPLETAAALARLRDEFGMTQQDLAETTGKPKSEISKLLAIHADVTSPVKALAESETDDTPTLTKRHLYNLSKLPPDDQLAFANRVKQENLSALETEELVAARLERRKPKTKSVGLAARRREFHTATADVVFTFRKARFTTVDIQEAVAAVREQLRNDDATANQS